MAIANRHEGRKHQHIAHWDGMEGANILPISSGFPEMRRQPVACGQDAEGAHHRGSRKADHTDAAVQGNSPHTDKADLADKPARK